MMSKHGMRYTAKFKFQVILELLKGSKTIGQISSRLWCSSNYHLSLEEGVYRKRPRTFQSADNYP